MQKIELNNTTFIVFLRIDNEERLSNIIAMTSFYRNNIVNPKFIFIEDTPNKMHCDVIKPQDGDQYFGYVNTDQWKKSYGYNIGITNATTDILCFNDVDCIVDPKQLLDAEQRLLSNNNFGLLYPYDGRFLCALKNLKERFIASGHDINVLLLEQPDKNSPIGYQTENVLVGHTNSRGGIVMARKDNIIKCNGYNPTFKGWGWEDSEIPVRVMKLGYDVALLNIGPLWHLHHFNNKSSRKETQPYYTDGQSIAHFVDHATTNEIKEYIKTWKL